MERKELAEEIINFCTEYRLFKKSKGKVLSKEHIAEQLSDVFFVENLIHLLILKTKYRKNIDKKRLKRLLIELEKERLSLEYGE